MEALSQQREIDYMIENLHSSLLLCYKFLMKPKYNPEVGLYYESPAANLEDPRSNPDYVMIKEAFDEMKP